MAALPFFLMLASSLRSFMPAGFVLWHRLAAKSLT
jgi:hypothetical protein